MKAYSGVRQVGKGVYEVNFRPYRKADRIYRRVKASSKQEAYQKRAQLIAEYTIGANRTKVQKYKIPFRWVYRGLIKDVRADNLSKKSLSRYKLTFRKLFFEFLPKYYSDIKYVDELTTPVFNDYKKYYVNDLGNKGWRSELIMVKAVIKRLVVNGYCKKEIVEEVGLLKRPKHVQKKYREVTREEKKRILEFIKKDRYKYYGYTYCLMRCGWRPGEATTLRKENVKFNGKSLISLKIEAEHRKVDKDLVLRTFDKEFENVIKKYYFVDNSSEWLFYDPKTKHKRIDGDMYYRYLTKISPKVIGKYITPYDLKHSFFTEMADSNAPLKAVQEISGVETLSIIIDYYTHNTDESRRQVLSASKI